MGYAQRVCFQFNGLSNAQFVDTLIANTGASFTTNDRISFVNLLDTNAHTRAEVLRMIAEYQAFMTRNTMRRLSRCNTSVTCAAIHRIRPTMICADSTFG